jgi:hypothetical protein
LLIWDAAGIASFVGVIAGIPWLAWFFGIYLVGTIALLWWRYRGPRKSVSAHDNP